MKNRLLVVGSLLSLLVYEFYALATNHETISRMVYNTTEAWGLFPFLCGLIIGTLATHFWWRWSPEQSKKGGG